MQQAPQLLAGRDVTRLKPAERGVGYVPQDLALFPTLTVHAHLGFALRVRGWDGGWHGFGLVGILTAEVFNVPTDRATDPFDTRRPRGCGLGKYLQRRVDCHVQAAMFVRQSSASRTASSQRVALARVAMGLASTHKPTASAVGP